jgi:hypothetical protein
MRSDLAGGTLLALGETRSSYRAISQYRAISTSLAPGAAGQVAEDWDDCQKRSSLPIREAVHQRVQCVPLDWHLTKLPLAYIRG